MALRPWSPVPIHDCAEPLVELPAGLLRLEPHPYAGLGAPYGAGASPFRLRAAVVERLLEAQLALQAAAPGWRLAIFDAWRPLAVQRIFTSPPPETPSTSIESSFTWASFICFWMVWAASCAASSTSTSRTR